jgi:hypothetical protein
MLHDVLFALGGAVAAVVSSKVYAWIKAKVVTPAVADVAKVEAAVKGVAADVKKV